MPRLFGLGSRAVIGIDKVARPRGVDEVTLLCGRWVNSSRRVACGMRYSTSAHEVAGMGTSALFILCSVRSTIALRWLRSWELIWDGGMRGEYGRRAQYGMEGGMDGV